MLIWKSRVHIFLRKSMRTIRSEGQVASGFCPHQVMSYNALAAVLDLLVETRSRPVCPEALQAAVQSHLHHRLAAYGAAAFPPKAHYSHHLADQLRRHGALVSLWTHERKHKELKRWAHQSHNASKGSSWERGLLEEVVLQQALALEEWHGREGTCLLSPHAGSQDLLSFFQARGIFVNSCEASLRACQRRASLQRRRGLISSQRRARSRPGLVSCSSRAESFHMSVAGWHPEGRHVFDMNDDPCWVETGSIVESKAYKLVHGRKAMVMA